MISSDVPERETFLANALQWSIRGSHEYKSGHPQLHQSIAQILWKGRIYHFFLEEIPYCTLYSLDSAWTKLIVSSIDGTFPEKNYALARYHFLHSTDGSGCATMLVELHRQRGYSSEVDLFIAQAVLQLVCY
jgi:Protein of unknown function (DUF410).